MRSTLLSLALFTACYSPGYRDCEVTCAASLACPSGYQCSPSGHCVTDLAMSCTGTDGGTGDGSSGNDGSMMLGPWGTPRPVEFVGGTPMGIDDTPTLTDDMLLLYVHRRVGSPAQHDINGALRSSPSVPFPSPGLIDVSTSANAEMTPELSGNGLEIYFSSLRSGTGGFDIFYASRASLTAAFSAPITVAALNSPVADGSPAISRDNMTIVWASARSGVSDLYIANRQSPTMTWSMPMAMTALNDPAFIEDHPFLSADKLTIYFSSDRSGDQAIWTATRTSLTGNFGPPSRIVELDTPNVYDGEPWVSPDNRTIYFTRVVGGAMTLMYATR